MAAETHIEAAKVGELLDVKSLLLGAFRVGASDIHFRVDQAPRYRVSGQLKQFQIPALNLQAMQQLIVAIAGQKRLQKWNGTGELEFSFEIDGAGRFRASVFNERGRPAVVLRTIPSTIPDLRTLRLPPVLRKIIDFERGLVLVTGSTGMGKSTTCASLLSLIAESAEKHVLTIEDPIEFNIPNGKGTVTQREIGRDVATYLDGLHAALRQDPDVLFIGELRERDEVSTALQAAESGHLVLATFHTNNTVSTIMRMAAMFPNDEQQSIRLRLANVLTMSISQKLLPCAQSVGRVIAVEVMLTSPSVVEAIREQNKLPSLDKFIANGRYDYGMQTFDQHLTELYQAGLITVETARAAAEHPSDFMRGLHITR